MTVIALLCGVNLISFATAAPLTESMAVNASTGGELESELLVPTNGQKILKFTAPINRIAIGDPKIASVKIITSRQLRVYGVADGITELSVWISGENEVHQYNVTVGANVDRLQEELQRESLADISVKTIGAKTLLKGKVKNLSEAIHVQKLAEAHLGGAVENNVEVADRRMVAVEIRFAAVSVNTMKALGINFRTLGNGFQFAGTSPGTVQGYSMSPVNTDTGLDLQDSLPLSQAFNLFLGWPGNSTLGILSVLSSANLAQLLAEPTLLVRSGEEADFLAGGEIPIPVPQSGFGSGTVTIEYKKFGVQLGVSATVLDDKRIVLRVSPEVSELDAANGISIQGYKIPAIRTRSTRTTVELGDGQSFVLAGLMYSSSANVQEAVPGLGDLPVIGAFFKRSQNARDQQELIIIATPRLVSPLEADKIPALPGTSDQQYNPTISKMLLNTETLQDHIAEHGLLR